MSDIEARLSKIEEEEEDEAKEDDKDEAKEDDEDEDDEDDEGKDTVKKSGLQEEGQNVHRKPGSKNSEAELAAIKEDNRKLRASFDKLAEKQTATFSARSGESELRINSEGTIATGYALVGKNLVRN